MTPTAKSYPQPVEKSGVINDTARVSLRCNPIQARFRRSDPMRVSFPLQHKGIQRVSWVSTLTEPSVRARVGEVYLGMTPMTPEAPNWSPPEGDSHG